MENMMVCEDAGKIFGPESGLSTNPTVDEIRNAVNEWIGNFKSHVLEDMDGLTRQAAGTSWESYWREMRERYASEIEELAKEIHTLNDIRNCTKIG